MLWPLALASCEILSLTESMACDYTAAADGDGVPPFSRHYGEVHNMADGSGFKKLLL